MKKEKKEKKTLYATLLEQFINAGYKVEEGEWEEGLGYDQPTTEYWFDLKVTKDDNLFTMNYWFGSDLNTLKSVEVWRSRLEIVETDEVKLF
jgi:hypothetical protein